MGFAEVFKQIFTFVRLLNLAKEFFEKERPDLVVIIDYPAFHWKLAKRARSLGIPVIYFVPPQIWAWAQWRVRKMRRLISHVLSALPFEHDWLSQRGVPSTYVGHPYFDELAAQKLDDAFLDAERRRGGRIVGILPGSRNQEVTMNVREMLRAARIVHRKIPTTRFLVAAFNEHQAEIARAAVARAGVHADVHVGRTPEIIELAECCIAVSGSVSLEMMFRRTPAIIVYRMKRLTLKIARKLIKLRSITLVNMLANETIYPEFPTDRDPSIQVAAQALDLLNDPERSRVVREKLAALCDRVAKPGACAVAAKFILDFARSHR
jgi:lipid-A-disaccharide synthase